MAKKKSYNKKSFESTGATSDTSANLYMSMLMAAAWMDITALQRQLYLYCKAQYYAEKRKPDGNPLAFTMNRSKWCLLYKLYQDNASRLFRRDRDALIAHGFIRVIYNGQNNQKKSIYEFSDMWQKWGTQDFIIKPGDMSSSMLTAYRNDRDTNRQANPVIPSNPEECTSQTKPTETPKSQPRKITPDTDISIILVDESEHHIPHRQIDEWAALYPDIDVVEELNRICGEAKINPDRRRDSEQVINFINISLKIAQVNAQK